MEGLNTFLGSTLGTLVVGLLGWIGAELLSIRKQGILDRAKFEIDAKKLEHEVRFKKVYDKVSEILIQLAPMPMKATKAVSRFVNEVEWSDASPKADQWKDVANSYNETRAFLHDNRLLIPKPIFNEVDEFVKSLKSIIDKYQSGRRNADRKSDGNQIEDYTANAQNALKELEPRYNAIHEAMQTYLGIATQQT